MREAPRGDSEALLSLTMKIPAALAAGNTVVVKPSEFTPYTPILFGRACLEAGIPKGVVNIVSGGVEAGEALVAHRSVEKISFTGGVKAATAMMKTGAPLIKPFCFELGGKSAHVVFEDADLDLAAKTVCAGLSNAGQSCTFGSRIFVHDDVYDKFKSILVSAAQSVKVGDPLDPDTFMGPLFSSGARDRVLSMIDAGSKGAGRVLTGGGVPHLSGSMNNGYFVEPTVFDEVDPMSALATEEIFGPVMSIFRFSDEDEVVSAVNNTDFGLSNYVHTNDLRRAIRVTARVKSGTVYVNDATRSNVGAPFGGFRKSGIGYEGGRAGLDEYLRRKTVGLA
jgi:aldehyde dehydrogenase (NAD+)